LEFIWTLEFGDLETSSHERDRDQKVVSRPITAVRQPSWAITLRLYCIHRLKLISFTNPFIHISYSFRTDFTVFNLYCIKGALRCLF